MTYRLFAMLTILLLITAAEFSCSARGTTNSGISGTTGVTATSGGTTGTGTAAPTTLGSGTPKLPGTSDRIRPRIAERNEDDIWITKEVAQKLNETKLSDSASIDVDSNDRIVTLEGTVASSEEADLVIGLARSVPTVKDVVSKLKTKQ
jgi:hypothetical protein